MGKVYLIGVGPGDYQLITLKAVECLKKADVVIFDRLVNKRYLDFTRDDVEKIYADNQAIQAINELMMRKAQEGKTVVHLIWGDPFVFNLGGEEAEELYQQGISFEIVPGINTALAVPAYVGIPLTYRDYATSVHIINGHKGSYKNISPVNYQLAAKVQGTLVFLQSLSNIRDICHNLITWGKSIDTPIAVITQGTTSNQKKVVGTLSDIEDKVKKEGLVPPSVIVVGEVVNLHKKLDWFFKKPLSGKRILITRTKSQTGSFAQKIEDLGGEVYSFPTIKVIDPSDYRLIDNKIKKIEEYDWIIFTSVNGVKSFFSRLINLQIDIRLLAGIKIGAIGSATGKALEEKGVFPDYIPEKFQAEAMAAGLKDIIKKGQRVLLPTADIARKVLEEELSRHGALVDKIDIYHTVSGEGEREFLLEWLHNREIDIITFTSSSTVRNFVRMLGPENLSLLKDVKVASIGPITSATAVDLGLNVQIEAQDYNIDGLIKAILDQEGN